jgi:S-formylglutathione hydrolase FrmB
MSTGLSVLAPDCPKADRGYRIVYLLHGLHGDHETWLNQTMLPVFANDFNALFVMPEVGRSFYRDMRHGLRFFTYVIEELPDLCKRVFNVSGSREDTAVIGCSMGGYGALKCALSKPQQYGFCGAISTAAIPLKQYLEGLRADPSQWLKTGGAPAEALLRDFYAIFGDDLPWDPGDDLIELARNLAGAPVKPRIYASCGTEDEFRKENLDFKAVMEKLDFDFTYEEWPGVHGWYFFSRALQRSLQQWYGEKPE